VETVAITIRNSPRIPRLKESLESAGINDYRIFYGLNGKKSGLKASIPYEVDSPGSGYTICHKHVGCTMSHWMLWNALDFDPSTPDAVMILEDDVLFLPHWRETIERALTKLPDDWDILYPGSCCAHGKLSGELDSNLFGGMPLCTHCYIVRKKALKTLIDTNEEVYAPIDLQMYFKSRHLLKCFTIFPRVVDQDGVDLSK
jgi:GR25 family glycosyltransferase involved in LPS biosynthesis